MSDIKITSTTSKFVDILLCFILAFVFVLVYSEVASPLTFQYEKDSSVFMMMGRMFIDGKLPYVDFFDHKGPSVILLEGIGQFFAPYRSGVFIVEVLCLFLVLFTVFQTGKFILDRKRSVILMLFTLIFLSRFFHRGNTTEEMSLLALFLSLYFTCKYFFKTKAVDASIPFVIGVCFSFLFWLRLNNAGLIVAFCIFMFVDTLINKDYKSLKNLIGYFILGQLPFTILYCGYFLYHDALYEMIYATFIYNFKYIGNATYHESNNFTLYFAFIFLFLLVGSLLYYKKEKDYKVFIFSGLLFVFSFLTINVGYAFKYYFLLVCPAVVFACLLVLNSITKPKLINLSLVLMSVLCLGLLSRAGYYIYTEGDVHKEKAQHEKNVIYGLLAEIPEIEKERVYYYNIDASFYVIGELDTNYKYFVFQEWHGLHDEDIYTDINEMMLSDKKPLWIIMHDEVIQQSHNRERYNYKFETIVDDNYELYKQSEKYYLYHYKPVEK